MFNLLYGASGMILTFCIKVSLMRFFRRLKSSQIHWNFVHSNVRLPIVAVTSNAQQARLCTALLSASILRVFCGVAKTQVDNPIVRFNPVDVVNVTIGHHPINVQPS